MRRDCLHGLETVWAGDQDYTGGDLLYTSDGISNTIDLYLFRSARAGLYGDFTYNIPVTNGAYNLSLLFAEVQYGNPGDRVFNVIVNGSPVLAHFDIVAQAGARPALSKTFPITVTTGAIQIAVNGVVHSQRHPDRAGLFRAASARHLRGALIVGVHRGGGGRQPRRTDDLDRKPRWRHPALDSLEDAAVAGPQRHIGDRRGQPLGAAGGGIARAGHVHRHNHHLLLDRHRRARSRLSRHHHHSAAFQPGCRRL